MEPAHHKQLLSAHGLPFWNSVKLHQDYGERPTTRTSSEMLPTHMNALGKLPSEMAKPSSIVVN